jgi:predicted CoA-binding protein
MNDEQLKQLYASIHTIASVGLSSNPAKESYDVAAYLKSQGYRLIPVNPAAQEILGEKVYRDLLSIPDKIDVVQLFRPSDEVPALVEQAISIGARVVWMQPGISNEAAAERARAAGLQVIENHCMRAEHMRLLGSPFYS